LNRKTLVLFCLILAVAAAVRFAALSSIPQGVFLDEAIKGVEGIEAVHSGQFRLLYPANLSEGLWVAVLGFSESVFGVNQFGLRFAAAAAGTLTVVFIFLFARDAFGDRVALFAAWFAATGFWLVVFSRIAFTGILVPLLLTASLYFLRLAERPSKIPFWAWSALGGAIYGLGFHTYVAYRATPILVMFLFFFELLRRHKLQLPFSLWLKSFAVWLCVAIVVALPMGIYFLHHPQDFSRRLNELSISHQEHPVRAELQVLGRTLGMFNLHGDENWRHNFGGRPELLAPVGVLFLAGLWMVAVRARRGGWHARDEWLFISWFVILLLPELVTLEGVPHSLRAIGVAPPTYIFAAFGADRAWQLLAPRRTLQTILLAVVIAAGGYDLWRYFHDWARHGVHRGEQTFNEMQARYGMLLNGLPESTPRFVIYEEDTLRVDREDMQHPPGRMDYRLPVGTYPMIFATFNHREPVFLQMREAVACAKECLPPGSVIVPLEGRQQRLAELRERGIPIETRTYEGLVYGVAR
jgi:hypothetical protein